MKTKWERKAFWIHTNKGLTRVYYLVPSMSQNQQNQTPPASPGYAGITAAPSPPAQAHLPTIGGVTRVNSTNDPRVIWEDGNIAVIFARDFPANTGMGRSATRKNIKDAIMSQIDPTRVTMPGAGSMNDFCKVVLAELLARPQGSGKPNPTTSTMFKGRPPVKSMIASGYGSVPKGTVIPDAHFPHVCGMCGNWYYQGTGEHDTPDSKCPAVSPKKAKK